MATNVVKALREDFLHCSICMNRFTVPKVLPCIHSFCQHCLEKYAERLKSNKLPCPTCRKVCDLTETGVKGLQTNFHLVNLGERMDLIERLDSSKSKSSTCDSCESTDVSVYCFECDFKICDKCQSQHKRFPTLRSHTVVPINEIKHPKYQQALQTAKAPNCDVHPTESLRFYCKTCSKLICRDCTIVQHPKPDHECVEASRQLSDVKRGLSTLLSESASHLARNLEFIKTGQAGSEEIAKESNALRHEIRAAYEDIKRAIEKQLKSQMENMCSNVSEVEAKQRVMISEKVKRASTWVTSLKNIQSVTQKLIDENNMWEILGMSSDIMTAFYVLKSDSNEFSWHQSELKQRMFFYPQSVPSMNLGRCRSECDVVLNDANGNFITCTFDRRTSTVHLSRLRRDNNYNWDEADHISSHKWETGSPANAKLTATLSSSQLVFVSLGTSIGVFNLSNKSFENVMMAKGTKDFTHVSWLGFQKNGSNYIYVKQSGDPRVHMLYYDIQYQESYERQATERGCISHTMKHKNRITLTNAGETGLAIPDQHSTVDNIIVYSNCLLYTLEREGYNEETSVFLLKENKCTVIKPPPPKSLVAARNVSVFEAPFDFNVGAIYQRPGFVRSYGSHQQAALCDVAFSCYLLWCGNRGLFQNTGLTYVITAYDSRQKDNIRSWNVSNESSLPVACYQDTSTNKLKVCDINGKVTTCCQG